MKKLFLCFLILLTLATETLVVCKRKSDANIGGNYDDETNEILNELREDIEKNDKKKNNNKFKFNDDVDPLEDDLAKAAAATTVSSVISKATSSKLSQSLSSSQSPPSSNTFVNNHEYDTSNSWTIFFILCILGKEKNSKKFNFN